MKTVNANNLELIKKYYALVDSNKPDEFMNYFSEDAAFRFANSERIVGREEIRRAIVGLLNSINGIRHDLTNAWKVEENVVVLECDVTYTRKDNKQVVVHGAVVNVIQNGLFKEQRLYVDVSPVFA